MVKITYFGHSSVKVENEYTSVFIDPFFINNPSSTIKNLNSIKADYIVVTHAHADHLGDTVAIAQNNNSLVLSNSEIISRISNYDIKCHAMYISGKYNIVSGWIKFFPALHGSSFEDGTYGGLAIGVMIKLDGKMIYHAGDTGLTVEFKAIGELYNVDIALLPVGGNFTMDCADAAIAAKWIGAKKVIPIHYNTWDRIAVKEQDIINSFQNITELQILKCNQSMIMD